MNLLNSVKKVAVAYGNYAERSAALKTLKQLSAHQLADIGIEPHMLSAGVSAYPWKHDSAQRDNSDRLTEAEGVFALKPMPNTFTLFSAWGQPIRPW